VSGPMYPACIHHAYAADLRGSLLRVPCWNAGCPGAKPHPDSVTADTGQEDSCPRT
jgi:hypothetical protein